MHYIFHFYHTHIYLYTVTVILLRYLTEKKRNENTIEASFASSLLFHVDT